MTFHGAKKSDILKKGIMAKLNEHDDIKDILSFAEKYNTKIILPVDFKCNKNFSNDGDINTFTISNGIPNDFMGLDIGNDTISLFKSILFKSDIIIWNGPLGVFEFDNFAIGSKDILTYISSLKNSIKIIGGGDIVSCCEKFNLSGKMNHVSTGGGASLELLEGKTLPGIQFLENSALQLLTFNYFQLSPKLLLIKNDMKKLKNGNDLFKLVNDSK